MDVDISRWILEFIIREPVEDRLVNALLSVLPLPDDPRLMKTILLRRIHSEISTGLVSEKTLESLEMIEDLDYREGNAVLDSMKTAYCAVAMDCTVRFLREKSDGDYSYFDAVKRIWRGKIHQMEISENVGLVSVQLKDSREEIEAATCDETVRERISTKDTRGDALKLVRVYLEEAWKVMGPSFLKFAAQMMTEVDNGNGDGVGNLDGPDDEDGEEAVGLVVVSEGLKDDNEVVSGENFRDIAVDSEENSQEEMLQSSKAEVGNGITSNTYDFLPSPEVNRVQEALISSTVELQTLVNDPLPNALDIATRIVSNIESEKNDIEPSEDQNAINVEPNRLVDGGVGADEKVKVCDDSHARHRNDVRKRPSLMDHNSTARTYEWDDNVEGSPEGSSPSRKFHLRSPKKNRLVSPLKKLEVSKFARRRKFKRWSSLEEDTLRIAVEKCGRGNWKLILNTYREIFEERTEVDLKDKWRNMIR